jgi:hypothetical protein
VIDTEVTGGTVSIGLPVEKGADVLMSVSIAAIDTVGLLEVGDDEIGAVVVGDNVGIDEMDGNIVVAPIVGSAVDVIGTGLGSAVDVIVIGTGLGPGVSSCCAAIDAGASTRYSSASAAMRGSGSIIIFI